MAIFVDECRWWYRDHQMCHMVSDNSLQELHAFAEQLGMPERAFHGDHYDVPAHIREQAICHGAVAVTSRELVQALTRAGLRLSAAQRRTYKHEHTSDVMASPTDLEYRSVNEGNTSRLDQ